MRYIEQEQKIKENLQLENIALRNATIEEKEEKIEVSTEQQSEEYFDDTREDKEVMGCMTARSKNSVKKMYKTTRSYSSRD